MAGLLAKWVSKKILAEKLENKFGQEDPYFEQVPATRLDGTPSGKFKKRRKALPPGLSEKDGMVLTKVKRRAYRLDMSLFSCCGVRFGWGSVIGIIPAVGDALDAFMAMMVVQSCKKIDGGLPSSIHARMLFNVFLDFLIGLVPFVGDVADAAFRANTRNAILLEDYLREKGKQNLRKSGLPVPTVDPSDRHEFDRLHDEDSPDFVDRPPQVEGRMAAPSSTSAAVDAPARAKLKSSRNPERRGFFGWGGQGRSGDLEAGTHSDRSVH